jgi:membrane-associated phospholipid phosphatase
MKEEVIRELGLLGSFVTYLSITVLFLIFREYDFAVKLIIGLIICFVVVTIFRLLRFRDRPKKMTYKNIFQRIDSSSFPSMHAMRSMFLGLMLGSFFNNLLVYLIMIALSLLTGYSRVITKRHHLSDVIFGHVLGVVLFYSMHLLYP